MEWCSGRFPERLRQRAEMVLACDRGLSNTQVARQFGVRTATVWKWRERFRLGRLPGLNDKPHTGRPKKVRSPT